MSRAEREGLQRSAHAICRNGGMADAHGSGPCDSNIMRVQVPSPALLSTVF